MTESKLNLAQWLSASCEQRMKWLHQKMELDETSRQVLFWKNAFQDHGATIPDDTALSLWREICEK